jgi:hypothetical protein
LHGVRPIAHRFAGKHSQRKQLQITATEDALRAGRLSLARALVAERLAVKPGREFNRGFLDRCQSLATEESCPA